MAIQSNFPAIKPSLNLDFANTKKLDSRITFTRASTATYYDGVTTAKAEENLLLRSQDYSATWTVTNLTPVTGKTAPDSTSTATEFTATAANAVLTQGYTAIAGSYTFSVFLRRVTGAGDIQIAADNGTWTTKVITGTWARYDVTQTVAAGSNTAGVRVVTDTDAIEVWGAQLEQRSAVTAYTPTTTQAITNYIPVLLTAANNVPRFDHNPTTAESLGLLIEESRTNLLTYSAEFDNAAWTKTNSSITSNTAVAPDGTLTSDTVVMNDVSNNDFFIFQVYSGWTSGVTYTQTWYVKSAGISWVQVTGSTGTAATNFRNINIVTGALGNGNYASSNVTVTSVGNGWYRISVTETASNTSASGRFLLALLTSDVSSRLSNVDGDGYSGIYIWGAQLEAGAFPTSYIATGAATATRSADVASMIGPNFSSWYNAAEGTLFAEFAWVGLRSAAGQRILIVDNGTTTNYWGMIGTSTNTMQNPVVVNGATEATNGTPATTYSVNTYYKQAVAVAVNNTVAAINGVSGTTDTAALVPTVNTLRLCASSAGVGENIRIRRIAYYTLRLTNAQLQALTG